jgi:hypothetical protein
MTQYDAYLVEAFINVTAAMAKELPREEGEPINPLLPKDIANVLDELELEFPGDDDGQVEEFMNRYEAVLPESYALNSDKSGYWLS